MEQTSRRLAVPAMEQAVERRTWRRAAPILAGCALAVLFLVGPGARLADLLRGADWGSDWRWLEDGLRRLAAGLPLTDPRYVAGPWSQFDPGPAYTWSLQPPFVATLIAPALALPDGLRTGAWMLAADLAIWRRLRSRGRARGTGGSTRSSRACSSGRRSSASALRSSTRSTSPTRTRSLRSGWS